jgi:hypothetical protein
MVVTRISPANIANIVGIMRALNRNVERVFNPDRKDKRRLAMHLI